MSWPNAEGKRVDKVALARKLRAYQITQIMVDLENAWISNPDMRLGQMIFSLGYDDYLHDVDDEELIKVLLELYDS